MQLRFSLHPAQLEVFTSPRRFVVVMAGRRFGKTYLSAVKLLVEALKVKNDYGYELQGKDVFYVAPTKDQARDIMWGLLRRLGQGVIESSHENTMVARLVNGRIIHLKGSDRPDSLRGIGLGYVVLDEYATMKPEVWELIVRPTLSDVRGGALFIGTPDGKNHFHDLHQHAENNPDWAEDWQAFRFTSRDNPFLSPAEIETARKTLSHVAFRQEYEAQPITGGGLLLNPEQITGGPEPKDGSYVLAIDLAGFAGVDEAAKLSHELRRLDEHAIACVKIHAGGWYVDDILYGRWGIRETSVRIMGAIRKYQPVVVGIERGALKNAVLPYLTDQMGRIGVYRAVTELSHGGKSKVDRIAWGLQGRLEHGRVTAREGGYLRKLRDQMTDFPNQRAHDDLLDALAYVDQLAQFVAYGDPDDAVLDTWDALDVAAGY